MGIVTPILGDSYHSEQNQIRRRASGVPSTRLQAAEFACEMDSDLTRHVIVSRFGQEITVQVRYASDVWCWRKTSTAFAPMGRSRLSDDNWGTIDYATALLFGLFRWQRRVRF